MRAADRRRCPAAAATCVTPLLSLPAARPPARAGLLGRELPCERALRFALEHLSRGAVFSRQRARSEGLSPGEVAWVEEMEQTQVRRRHATRRPRHTTQRDATRRDATNRAPLPTPAVPCAQTLARVRVRACG